MEGERKNTYGNSNLVHACSGGVQQPQTWYMHAVGEFDTLKLGEFNSLRSEALCWVVCAP